MKPLLARLICAAAALRDVSVGELVSRTGLSTTYISQLRSGARSDIAQANQLLEALDVTAKALIKRFGQIEARHGQLDEALGVLLLCCNPERLPSPISSKLTCDRLAITLPQRAVNHCSKAIERVLHEGRQVRSSHYTRAVKRFGIFVGVGLRWKRWQGGRLEFNPSKLSHRGEHFIRDLVLACRTDAPHITRVDIAVDESVPIGWLQVVGTEQRKASTIWCRRVETIYVGSKNAPVSFAVYDKHAELAASGVSVGPGPLTRFEARLKKQQLDLRDLRHLENPFAQLRLLWLGGDLDFEDRVLARLAVLAGWPLLERELPRSRFVQLRDRFAAAATSTAFLHPRVVFDAQWKTCARDLLTRFGMRR